MFKKLGTLVLTAAIAVLGMQAAPAQADPLDATGDAVIQQSAQFNYVLNTSTFTVPAGATQGNVSRYWNIRAADLAGHGGETLTIVGSLTKPDGTVINIAPGTTNGSMSVNLNIYTAGGPVSNNWSETSLTVPASGATGGSANVSFMLSGWDMNTGMQLPVQAGTYTFDASIKLGTTVETNGTNPGDAWYLQDHSYSYSLAGASVTAPAGSNTATLSATVCVDPTKITAGDNLTVKAAANGTASNSVHATFEWRGYSGMTWRQASNGMNTTTVVAGDLTYGLAASANFNVSVTPGNAYAATYQILNQNNADVTGSCAPAAPSKPTAVLNSGSIAITAPLPAFADDMSADCQLFDAAAPTVVVATKTDVYAMNGNINCQFATGLTVGHSYFGQVRGGYNMAINGPWSASSDAVLKAAAGVTFTTPVSGLNAGGKLALVSSTIAADTDAATLQSYSDGGNGILVLATNSVPDLGGGTMVNSYQVHRFGPAGADSTFAGNGTFTFTPSQNDYVSNGRVAWYGSRDKFVFSNANYPVVSNGMPQPEYQITTGSWNSATVSKISVPGSVFTAACVSAVGAGYSAIQMGGMSSPPTVSANPISAPTSTPLFAVNCSKSYVVGGQGMTLTIPVIVTVPDASTVNVVKALGTPGSTVNAATYSVSVNPSAGANDAAVTVFGRTWLQTGLSTQTTDARTIYTIKKDLTVATSSATWTSVASEPSLRLEANNDGTIWGFLVEGPSYRLFKLVGDTLTTKDVTFDTNADLTINTLSIPNGAQAGNAALLTVSRSSVVPGGTNFAMANADTATGAVTTYEVAKYSYTSGTGAISAFFVDSKNLYWLQTNTAAATKYSLYRWRDPAYVAVVAANQTISWTASPTSVTVGSTVTVAATASSNLAVTYASTDASKCTVTSAGVVTPVATSGTCTITANQTGNEAFNAAPEKTLAITIAAVVLTNQTISWTASPTSVTVGSTVTVAATASSNLAVTYASTDASKCTVTSAGVVTPVATSGTCTITANQAGNSSFNAAPQKTLTITISAVAVVKQAPKVPAVATKLKVGTLVTVVLSASKGTAANGANVDGLATVVSAAPASKAFCSVAKVVKAGKITGYMVKGLKAGKCSIVVTITGNDTYNALTKTVVATVTK